jgi:hypothetical protein
VPEIGFTIKAIFFIKMVYYSVYAKLTHKGIKYFAYMQEKNIEIFL